MPYGSPAVPGQAERALQCQLPRRQPGRVPLPGSCPAAADGPGTPSPPAPCWVAMLYASLQRQARVVSRVHDRGTCLKEEAKHRIHARTENAAEASGDSLQENGHAKPDWWLLAAAEGCLPLGWKAGPLV